MSHSALCRSSQDTDSGRGWRSLLVLLAADGRRQRPPATVGKVAIPSLSQYQQNPMALTGGIIDTNWFRAVHHAAEAYASCCIRRYEQRRVGTGWIPRVYAGWHGRGRESLHHRCRPRSMGPEVILKKAEGFGRMAPVRVSGLCRFAIWPLKATGGQGLITP